MSFILAGRFLPLSYLGSPTLSLVPKFPSFQKTVLPKSVRSVRTSGACLKICSIFPGGSDCKEFTYSARDLGSNPETGRSLEERNDYSLQYSCLENSMIEEPWATANGVTN